MEQRPPAYYLVVDLEATCNDDNSFPREEMEIIEIGAVMVNGASLEIVDEFQAFIRPVRHPELTTFCTKLTTITQEMVDSARKFPEVAEPFEYWAKQYPEALLSSWGSYDRSQLLQDYGYHKIEFPFGEQHLNIKAEFAKRTGARRQMGMAGALSKAGLPLIGTHHRGIDDARNIAQLLRFLLTR